MPTIRMDGRRVDYSSAGAGTRPPLLLVHGYTGSKEDFEPVLDGLAGDRPVVAVDLPGHGGSEGTTDPDGYALAASAAWLVRFADAVGLGDHHLLGHSMGGLISQRVAAAASQRLRSLVLASSGLGALRREAADAVARVAVVARDDGLEAAYEESQRRYAELDLDPGAMVARKAREDYVRRRYLALEVAAVVGGARNLITAMPLGAFLLGIDIPVLVLHGEADYAWTPAEQALLARTVRGAELAVVPDSYHSPQLENPSAWLDAVAPFLRRADALPPGSMTRPAGEPRSEA